MYLLIVLEGILVVVSQSRVMGNVSGGENGKEGKKVARAGFASSLNHWRLPSTIICTWGCLLPVTHHDSDYSSREISTTGIATNPGEQTAPMDTPPPGSRATAPLASFREPVEPKSPCLPSRSFQRPSPPHYLLPSPWSSPHHHVPDALFSFSWSQGKEFLCSSSTSKPFHAALWKCR